VIRGCFFQDIYLHIFSYPHISLLTLLCFLKIRITCERRAERCQLLWRRSLPLDREGISRYLGIDGIKKG
jgi:hypothetical protein